MRFDQATPNLTTPHPTELLEGFAGRDWQLKASVSIGTIADAIDRRRATLALERDPADTSTVYAGKLVRAQLAVIETWLLCKPGELVKAVKNPGDYDLDVLRKIDAWCELVCRTPEADPADPTEPQ
jgi:hypothetical protein